MTKTVQDVQQLWGQFMSQLTGDMGDDACSPDLSKLDDGAKQQLYSFVDGVLLALAQDARDTGDVHDTPSDHWRITIYCPYGDLAVDNEYRMPRKDQVVDELHKTMLRVYPDQYREDRPGDDPMWDIYDH